jgi:hypothetical protein
MGPRRTGPPRPERGYLREGENMETAGHPPNLTENTFVQHEGPVICTYDLTKFGASVVMDGLRTHPLVIIGGLLQQNPFFVPPDQLPLEIRERRLARESTSTA